ncbi:hypothetical protein AVEN_223305-1 [Araneus ventricosus]|uniref:Transposase Tc1-like domain-containing protein n=1 Tax=Araneus ventricosus TaxID=182803 RepID=A0A4Y2GA78_ARAVE|nr:hypothetical protein AVEN_223305-1 [Araneus ventricosus]
MECADATTRPNVSRSVVQRLGYQFRSKNSVSRGLVPGRPRVTNSAEDRFPALSARIIRATTVPQLVSDQFAETGTRKSGATVRKRFHNQELYARKLFVRAPLTRR